MVKTPSTMVPLGTKIPSFTLPDTISDKEVTLSDIFASQKGVLVMFICNHCPFVIHVQDELSKLGKDYGDKLAILAISSNNIEDYPQDSPDKMKKFAKDNSFNFPYLYDETQEVAKSFNAACTPDFFLYNQEKELVYRGQLDASRPGNEIPVTGKDLRGAIDALLEDKEISKDQIPSIGCNIKWKD